MLANKWAQFSLKILVSNHSLTEYIYIYIYIYISALAGCDTSSIFKRRLTSLNSVYSFKIYCHTKAKVPPLPHNLPITRRRIITFITFLRILMLYGNATNLVHDSAGSISYDINQFTTRTHTHTHTHKYIHIYLFVSIEWSIVCGSYWSWYCTWYWGCWIRKDHT